MTLADEFQTDPETERVRARLELTKRELAGARRTIAALEQDVDSLQRIANAATKPLAPPKWLRPKKRTKGHRGSLVAVLSDTHFDEVVNPAELNGFNAFDRAIADMRLEAFFDGIVKLARGYFTGVEYDGIVLVLGGDILSGNIHDLQETNEGTLFDGALYWSERIAAGITMLAEEFGRVFVPCTVGNHPRLTVRERTKRRVRDNADWLISKQLERYFADDERVQFLIPDAIDVPFEIYDTRFLLYHGQTGGGGGIGGIWPPLMRLKARKASRWAFDVLLCGHWHQLVQAQAQGLIVNGSLKGYDEFAVSMAFAPEQPQQALFLVTPERGITLSSPVFVADPKAEGWA